MITAPTRPMIPVMLSARAAARTDHDGKTYINSPTHNPATAAPAKDVAFAAMTARAAVSGGTGFRVLDPVLARSRGRIRLRRPNPVNASPTATAKRSRGRVKPIRFASAIRAVRGEGAGYPWHSRISAHARPG